jgi:hypothetical protein
VELLDVLAFLLMAGGVTCIVVLSRTDKPGQTREQRKARRRR